jgi:predicted enzyme related to lactoylglutathione lyase
MAKLMEVTIRVRDVERSRRFYMLVGAPCGDISKDHPDDQSHVHAVWGKWAAGSDEFLMLNIVPAGDGPAPHAELGFATDDLDALHASVVAAGADVVRPPETKPWGRMATYRDPDGNTVSVSQRPRTPPA